MSGICGTCSGPVAITKWRANSVSPERRCTVQRDAFSSKRAPSTCCRNDVRAQAVFLGGVEDVLLDLSPAGVALVQSALPRKSTSRGATARRTRRLDTVVAQCRDFGVLLEDHEVADASSSSLMARHSRRSPHDDRNFDLTRQRHRIDFRTADMFNLGLAWSCPTPPATARFFTAPALAPRWRPAFTNTRSSSSSASPVYTPGVARSARVVAGREPEVQAARVAKHRDVECLAVRERGDRVVRLHFRTMKYSLWRGPARSK